jgi:hypothetical protein
VLSGKNSAGVGEALAAGEAFGSLTDGECLADRSRCSFCASGISPTGCFSHEQMTINEAPAKMATHFHKKNRISAGTVIVASPAVQDESAESVAGIDDAGSGSQLQSAAGLN